MAQNCQTSSLIVDCENELYLKSSLTSTLEHEVKTQILEFTKWFNGTARLCLLRAEEPQCGTLISLLTSLEACVRNGIEDVGKSAHNQKQQYTCNCGSSVHVPKGAHTWKSLTSHEHIETALVKFLEGPPLTVRKASHRLEPPKPHPGQLTRDNSFRFNFSTGYDSLIEATLYPRSVVKHTELADGLNIHTVQKIGSNRIVCLLCACRLNKGFSKNFEVKSHIMGHRHLRNKGTAARVEALRRYHEVWMGYNRGCQAHQTHFLPKNKASCFCELCKQMVFYDDVLTHIHSEAHKEETVKLQMEVGSGNVHFLLDVQLKLYKVEVKPKTASGPQNDKTNGEVPCDIRKYVLYPKKIQIPPRCAPHLKYLEMTNKTVLCTACDVKFDNNLTTVMAHVVGSTHVEKSGIRLLQYSYHCEVCQIISKNEEEWLMHFTRGPNRHSEMQDKIKTCVEYECTVCHHILFGDEVAVARHTRYKKPRLKELKLPPAIKTELRSSQAIEHEAWSLTLEARKVLLHQERTVLICRFLEKCLASVFPNCKAYPFGSRMSGLGNEDSDLDVFMDIDQMYFGTKYQNPFDQQNIVLNATRMLRTFRNDFTQVVAIPAARTPIIKLQHHGLKLDCDVSFRHGLGVENTKFLRFCIDLQPITQMFILVLKKWLGHCRLNDHLSNYALAIMAVFYLQTQQYLLPVKTIRQYNPQQAPVVDGWEALTYTAPLPKIRELVKTQIPPIKEVLQGFFLYYAEFNYANQVVCPLIGAPIPKFHFIENPKENLPIEMRTYVERIHNQNAEHFRGLSAFCVQDPFDLSHNLTKACQPGLINKLKCLCRLTYQHLRTL